MREKIALIIVGLSLLAFSACRSNQICPAYTNTDTVLEERLEDNT
jgi:hypothetical protein